MKENVFRIPGSHPVFPGFYQETKNPANVGYVSRVGNGLVAYRGTKGNLRQALMGAHEFMERFEKIENPEKALAQANV